MSSGRLSDAGSFSITYNLPYRFYKFMKAHPMVDLSASGQKRLSMIEFYYQVKDATTVSHLFKISRKTFYKWLNRYEESGRKLSSLQDNFKTPHTKRSKDLDFNTEIEIKHLREKKIKTGKVKLQRLFKTKYGRFVSQSHITYVIQKYNLYYDPVKAKSIKLKKRKNRGAKKIRINDVNPNDYLTQEKPFFFTTDTIVLYLPYGIKRYVLTAIEQTKKIAYARCYSSKSSLSSFDFLMRLSALVDGKIATILSDNGSEFAKYFEEACKRLNIIHIYSRVHTPKDNPVCERFNRTIQEEFMEIDEYFEPLLSESDLTEANRRLTVEIPYERHCVDLSLLEPVYSRVVKVELDSKTRKAMQVNAWKEFSGGVYFYTRYQPLKTNNDIAKLAEVSISAQDHNHNQLHLDLVQAQIRECVPILDGLGLPEYIDIPQTVIMLITGINPLSDEKAPLTPQALYDRPLVQAIQ